MRKTLFATIFLFTCVGISTAYAGERTQVSRTHVNTSASWSVQAVGEGQALSNQPLTLSWSVSQGTAYRFFTFTNSGTSTINSFLVSITQSASSGNGNINDVTFERCLNGTWNSATNSCSGSVFLIGNASDLSFSLTNLGLIPNSSISMRATTKPNNRNNFITTVSTSISRLGIRSGAVINS